MIPTRMPTAFSTIRRDFLFYETVICSAHADFEPELAKRSGLRGQRIVRIGVARRISYLDVVGLVARHHLIARDAIGDGVHNGPLRSGHPPAAFGLFRRKVAHHGAAEIGLETAIGDEYTAP